MTTPRIVAIPGSLRRDSFNRKLVALGAAALREAGAEVVGVAVIVERGAAPKI